ncbi:unnamed protein product, partial [Onchocerca flexuosa]|uniref:C2H2-type domain-containing protein n=1 Tax=Onchocerca flexuosa TaxID=387005 RepID=A0A183GXX2_9BILA
MATKNSQLERVRHIHCLLCSVNKPFNGFLSHIRQKHLNYHRYKCTKCTFKSDNEEDSTLHSFEKNHLVKFDDVNYQEHLAVKIFQDCCRKQFAIRHETEKKECDNSGQTKRKGSGNSYSDIQKIHNPKKSKMKTNDVCLSSFLKDETNLQAVSENQRDYGISPNSTKCIYDEGKSESGIHNIKILSKAAASEPDDETSNALELLSDALKDTKTISPDNLPNVNTVDVVSIDGKSSGSIRNTFDHKEGIIESEKLLKATGIIILEIRIELQFPSSNWKSTEVDASYIAKKTHALQFHFTQDDDPEIAELLPATIKACFPHSLAWSDFQCTECGKTLGTYSSRRNHVLKEHFYWSTICPFSGCTSIINALDALEEHFN